MIFILLVVCVSFSCSNGCDDVHDELTRMKIELDKKNNEASELNAQLESIDISESEGIQRAQLVEDELMNALIEVAVLEINIEQFEKDNHRCL